MSSPRINKGGGDKGAPLAGTGYGEGDSVGEGGAVSKGRAGPVEFTVKAGHAHPNSSRQLEVRDGVPLCAVEMKEEGSSL